MTLSKEQAYALLCAINSFGTDRDEQGMRETGLRQFDRDTHLDCLERMLPRTSRRSPGSRKSPNAICRLPSTGSRRNAMPRSWSMRSNDLID